MPVYKCNNGKWRIGSGDCIYDTKEKAEKVWKAILASGQYGKLNKDGKSISSSESNIRQTQRRESSEEPK